MSATLPTYIYGRETEANENVWTEAGVIAYGAARAAAAALVEREACAQVCETSPERFQSDGFWVADQQACAAAIRARKDAS